MSRASFSLLVIDIPVQTRKLIHLVNMPSNCFKGFRVVNFFHVEVLASYRITGRQAGRLVGHKHDAFLGFCLLHRYIVS